MFDLEAAKLLRKRGLSYKQIAEETGCSEAWCKKNLNGVKKEVASTLDREGYRSKVEGLLEEFLSKVRML